MCGHGGWIYRQTSATTNLMFCEPYMNISHANMQKCVCFVQNGLILTRRWHLASAASAYTSAELLFTSFTLASAPSWMLFFVPHSDSLLPRSPSSQLSVTGSAFPPGTAPSLPPLCCSDWRHWKKNCWNYSLSFEWNTFWNHLLN